MNLHHNLVQDLSLLQHEKESSSLIQEFLFVYFIFFRNFNASMKEEILNTKIEEESNKRGENNLKNKKRYKFSELIKHVEKIPKPCKNTTPNTL